MSSRITAAVLALVVTQLGSCSGGSVGVSEDYGYWDGPAYDYGVDYYYGPPVFYGGWGPDYFVGPPPRRWDGRPHPRLGGGGNPSFRPAPPSRPMPSIPSGPRGPGMRGFR